MADRFTGIIITKGATRYSNIDGQQTAGTRLFGISDNSLNIEKILCTEQFALGETNSAKFEARLFNLSEDVSGCEIKVYIDDPLDPGTPYYLFEGIIDSAKKDRTNEYRDIIAYDFMYYARDVDVAEAWNGNVVWQGANPATLKDIRARLCTYIGLYDPSRGSDYTPMLNDDLTFPAHFTAFSSGKFGDILRMICELQGCIPCVPYQRQMRYIKLDTTTSGVTSITNNYDASNSEFEEYDTTKIDAINIYGTADALSQTVGASEPTNAYSMIGNIFILSLAPADINTRVGAVLNAIKNISYNPAKIELIVSEPHLQLGEKVKTTRNGITYYHYIFGYTLYGPTLVNATINCPAKGKDLDNTAHAMSDTLISGIRMTKIEQDVEHIGFIAESKNKCYKQATVPTDPTNGDLWYCTYTSGSYVNGWWYRYNGSTWEHTEDSSIGVNRSTLEQHAEWIEARVTKTGGAESSFAWRLTESGFQLISNNDTVLKVTSAGIEIAGTAKIGLSSITLNDINTTANYAKSTADSDLAGEHKLYYQLRYPASGSPTPPTLPTSWVTSTSTQYNVWSTVPPTPRADTATYKYIYYTCEQQKTGSGTVTTSALNQDRSNSTVLNWCSQLDYTYIDGGHIYANSITADKIDTRGLTAERIEVTKDGNTIFLADADDDIIKTEIKHNGYTLFKLDSDSDTVKIGGFSVDRNSLYSGSDFHSANVFFCLSSVGAEIEIAGHSQNGWVLKAGNHFGVDDAGIVWANAVNLTGDIHASTGRFDYGCVIGGSGSSAGSALIGEWRGFTALSSNDGILSITAADVLPSSTTTGVLLAMKDSTGVLCMRTAAQASLLNALRFYTFSSTRNADYNRDGITFSRSNTGNQTIQLKYTGSGGTTETISKYNEYSKLIGTWHASSSIIIDSDARIKQDINEFVDKYDTFYNLLIPTTFIYKDDDTGRVHSGFIAQDVKSALYNSGLTYQDFAGFEETRTYDPEEPYPHMKGLRYEEFIALNTWQIQKLKVRVDELERRITNV